MQNETLELFINDINDIREYINYIELVDNIKDTNLTESNAYITELKSHLDKFGVSKKIFEYKSITISLYGILEKHIGIWIKEFINQLPKIVPNYNFLPPKFREDHFNLSMKLIGMVSERKYTKYEDIEKESILVKLNSCIVEPEKFQLNSDAFYLHSGNLKHKKISEALSYLGINLTSTIQLIDTRSGGFLCKNSIGEQNFGLIDDLVDRRNYISHGGDIDEIINIKEFSKYLDFIEGYGRAVFQALIEKLIEFEVEHVYQKIDVVHGIYQKGSVICFDIEDNKICVGDFIIVKLIDGGFEKKEIFDIQKDKKSIGELSIETLESIGINVGSGVSQGQTFFIKKKFVECVMSEEVIDLEEDDEVIDLEEDDEVIDLEEDDEFDPNDFDDPNHPEYDPNICPSCSGTGYDPLDGGQCEDCYGTGDSSERD